MISLVRNAIALILAAVPFFAFFSPQQYLSWPIITLQSAAAAAAVVVVVAADDDIQLEESYSQKEEEEDDEENYTHFTAVTVCVCGVGCFKLTQRVSEWVID